MSVHPVKFSDADDALIRKAAAQLGKPIAAFVREAASDRAKLVLGMPVLPLSTEEVTSKTYEIAYGMMHLLGAFIRSQGKPELIKEAGQAVAAHIQKMTNQRGGQ